MICSHRQRTKWSEIARVHLLFFCGSFHACALSESAQLALILGHSGEVQVSGLWCLRFSVLLQGNPHSSWLEAMVTTNAASRGVSILNVFSVGVARTKLRGVRVDHERKRQKRGASNWGIPQEMILLYVWFVALVSAWCPMPEIHLMPSSEKSMRHWICRIRRGRGVRNCGARRKRWYVHQGVRAPSAWRCATFLHNDQQNAR